ncbi:MAG: MBL fold metallo-hydrolase [Clostridia bacterium]|nr:MBL fold metallo-hydrolase [Clostridia bacterium]
MSIILIICLIGSIIKIIPKDLKVYFIDVGQGDSTLIVTPLNKSILIDGGGSEFGSFDVGENTLLPYLLDRGIKQIDYIIISHFDTDHCRGIIYHHGKFKSEQCGYRKAI